MRYTSTFRLLIPAVILAAGLLVGGCEDDPILGPTDQEPSGGGSYGIIHFDAPKGDSASMQLDSFLNENPRRF